MIQATFNYPGIRDVRVMRYTQGHGTVPGMFYLEIAPQPASQIQRHGTVELRYGTTSILFPSCVVDLASLTISPEGHVEKLRIKDRRWKWQAGGEISGVYNDRNPDGSLNIDTEKTAQELAEMLLDAMGESSYDISALPTDSRPHVDWACENPARELSRLCDKLGCRVVLGAGSDPVRIVKLGVGQPLPNNDDVRSVSFGVDPPELPDSILLCGSERIFQSKLLLEAVGKDTDHSIKPLKDLSYAPNPDADDGGFSVSVLSGSFEGLGDDLKARQLARETVFRWYRIKSQADGTMLVPGLDYFPQQSGDQEIPPPPSSTPVQEGEGYVTEIEQMLPVRRFLVETYEDADGNKKSQPAFVSGTFWSEDAGLPRTTNTPNFTEVPVPFSLYTKEGIVAFGSQVFKKDALNKGVVADLYLTTSYPVRLNSNNQYLRYQRERQIRNIPLGTGPHVLQRKEVELTSYAIYGEDGTTVTEVVTNIDVARQEADFQIENLITEFGVDRSYEVWYRGIHPLPLDGATRQVTWIIDHKSGFYTKAALNTDTDPYVLSYREARRVEYLFDRNEQPNRRYGREWLEYLSSVQ